MCLITLFWQRHEERVIIISSKDNDNKVTDAENALQQITTLILEVFTLLLLNAFWEAVIT